MKCHVCKKKFVNGEAVIPVLHYTTDDRRGDFVGLNPTKFIHAHHLKEES